MSKLIAFLFMKTLIHIHYNTRLAKTGVIRSTSSEKLYQELSLESLKLRGWFRKLCLCYKLFNFSKEKLFLKILKYSQKSTCVGNSF